MADQPQTDRDWKSEAAAWRARAEHLQGVVDRLRGLAVAGEAAGFLAHELNNLFTPVVGYCHAAQGEGADEAMKAKALKKALAAAERVGEVSRAILGLAGSVGGELDNAESDVGVCVKAGLLALGAERWGREGVEVRVDVPRGTLVKASAGVVQQVVMNLVLNARRAMVVRRGRLDVVVKDVGGVVRMEVRDEGEGMAAEMMERSLSITYNDDTRTRAQGGEKSGGGDRYKVDVQELARSGSINGQARWGVRLKAETEKRKADMKAGEKNISRLRGAKIDASMSPIKVWDAGEVAGEMRGGEGKAHSSQFAVHMEAEKGVGEGALNVAPVVGGTSTLRVGGTAGDGPPPCGGGSDKAEGTGLGLALCLELVGRVGGKISARSRVGEGTVVTVEWPAAARTKRAA